MSHSLFSTYWYRVSQLKPLLRDSAVISRHVYRGETWYVLYNSLTGRTHRFNAAAYALIGQMDGRRTVQQIWDNAKKAVADVVPTQDEIIRLLGQLHEVDLIQSDILPSTVEIFHQALETSRNGLKQRVTNPFSMRFPLCDPDRFLERWSFLVAPLLTRGAFIAWLLIVLSSLVMAFLHWSELTNSLADRVFAPENLVLLWLTYPLIKFCHELGHAFAVKKWGGDVHEMGIILLAFTPIPYVDASASSAFSDKLRRIAVAAMGMMVELLLAALALLVWLNVETGLVSALAYNVMLIGGISTLLFNGNPLLRYDGYYILADLLEIPNLGPRSNRYLSYLAQRYFLKIDSAESPVTAAGEETWFCLYGPLACCYRIAVLIGLVWYVSGRFFLIGVILALWGTVSLFILPVFRGVSRLLENPAVRKQGSRMRVVAGGIAAGVILLLFCLPIPFWTNTQGVVWLPEQSMIRAGIDCEVAEVLVPENQVVDKNTVLIRGSDPSLEAELDVCRARLKELYARYNGLELHERVKRKMLLEDIDLLKSDLRQIEEKLEKLLIRSPARGKFILVDDRNLPGHFVKQGALLGYILAEQRPTVRAVVKQSDIGLIREQTTDVEVRLAERLSKSMPAKIERIVPSADLNLPSAALGTEGGGSIPTDPSDPKKLRALESVFQLDLGLPDEVVNPHIGERVYVRFEHGSLPLAMQWYRSLRQLFLRQFYV